MLIKKNEDLYEEFIQYIHLDAVRDAFLVLIGSASVLKKLNCHPERKGEIRDFRYYTTDEEHPFSFIINKNSLLFYLRQPAVGSKKYNLSHLKKWLSEVNENPKGEWTIRINNRENAISINEHILLRW